MFEELARIFSEDNNAVAQRELLVRSEPTWIVITLWLNWKIYLCLTLQGGDCKVCRHGGGEGSPLAKSVAEARREQSGYQVKSKQRRYFHLPMRAKETIFPQLWHDTIPGHLPDRPDDDRHGHPWCRLRRPHQLWQEEERVWSFGPGEFQFLIEPTKWYNIQRWMGKCMGIGRTRRQGFKGEERSGRGLWWRGKRKEKGRESGGHWSYATQSCQTRNIALKQSGQCVAL